MSSQNLTITAVVVVLLLALGGWFVLKSQNSATPSPTPAATAVIQTVPSPSPMDSSAPTSSSSSATTGEQMVTISSSGFSPATVTIKAGQTVTWTNKDTAMHTVNSDPHPVHTAYPPLNTVGRLSPGQVKSLSFPTAGTYRYHDHLNPDWTGTVVVQ